MNHPNNEPTAPPFTFRKPLSASATENKSFVCMKECQVTVHYTSDIKHRNKQDNQPKNQRLLKQNQLMHTLLCSFFLLSMFAVSQSSSVSSSSIHHLHLLLLSFVCFLGVLATTCPTPTCKSEPNVKAPTLFSVCHLPVPTQPFPLPPFPSLYSSSISLRPFYRPKTFSKNEATVALTRLSYAHYADFFVGFVSSSGRLMRVCVCLT